MAEKKGTKEKQKVNSIGKFFRDVRIELGKVIWPGRGEVVASTMVVIVAVAFFTVFIGLIDVVFVNIIKLISA